MAIDRVIDMDGVLNFRDLGDYPTADGRRVKTGRIFRSGHFGKAGATAITALDSLDVGAVVDLRRAFERDKDPALWPTRAETTLIIDEDRSPGEEPPHIAFLKSGALTAESVRSFMHEIYRELPYYDRHMLLFGQFLRALDGMGEDQAAIIQCAFGKDRTGILAGLTLAMLGVPEEIILEDFELTNKAIDLENNLPIAHANFCKTYDVHPPIEALVPMLGVFGDCLAAALDEMRRRDGSVEGYLDRLGVDAAMRDRLRARYLV